MCTLGVREKEAGSLDRNGPGKRGLIFENSVASQSTFSHPATPASTVLGAKSLPPPKRLVLPRLVRREQKRDSGNSAQWGSHRWMWDRGWILGDTVQNGHWMLLGLSSGPPVPMCPGGL